MKKFIKIARKYGLSTALSNQKLVIWNWARQTSVWPLCFALVVIIMVAWGVFMLASMLETITYQQYECPTIRRILVPEVQAKELPAPTVQELIVKMARESGVNVNDALRIAKCESQYGAFNFNKNSSAKGVYQFIDNTWANYCTGDVLSPADNIRCFMKLYPDRPSWWECQ